MNQFVKGWMAAEAVQNCNDPVKTQRHFPSDEVAPKAAVASAQQHHRRLEQRHLRLRGCREPVRHHHAEHFNDPYHRDGINRPDLNNDQASNVSKKMAPTIPSWIFSA